MEARQAYAAWSGGEAEAVAVAPGRVNLIGEHTDYNGGFVLPMAIERATIVSARRRDDRLLRVFARDLDRETAVPLDAPLTRQADHPWADYVLGVWAQWAALGHAPPGADVLVTGDVPIGCGLSSSASLTMAALKALETLEGLPLDDIEAALLGQRTENDFLGLSCGIMDPFVIRNARQGHALLLDCRSRAYEHIPVALPDAVFVIANTGVTRGLTGSKYNERVGECREAVHALRQVTNKNGENLRDFTLEDLASAEKALDPVPFRRARHVIGENARTLDAADALRAGDTTALGALMDASHESLRADYEVSCAELDTLCALGRGHPACYGARMTGAGFGGCTVHLVQRSGVDDFAEHLAEAYRNATGLEAGIIVSNAAPGARVIADA